eukprot:1145921-Pelagomonas_calceolata.AAC.2
MADAQGEIEDYRSGRCVRRKTGSQRWQMRGMRRRISAMGDTQGEKEGHRGGNASRHTTTNLEVPRLPRLDACAKS